MKTVGIIGGSGLYAMEGLEQVERRTVTTPYGEPSSALVHGHCEGVSVVFIARHGEDHSVPPHRVNYRANIRALADAGVDAVIAVNAVGGITARATTGALVVPDDIIDYTAGRSHTFYDEAGAGVEHVDMTWPFDRRLRTVLLAAVARAGAACGDGGVYAATEGPRLETPAEIRRLERDGCDIVGMTGMPECGLAREAGLSYAMLALVVNPAAGKSDREITMEEIGAVMAAGIVQVRTVLRYSLGALAGG